MSEKKQEKEPWNWREKVLDFLKSDSRLLDLTPAGGQFLLSLSHPDRLCAAERSAGKIPFPESSFDLVLNDGGEYDLSEVWRVLKSGGFFLTQQAGGEHFFDFRRRFCPEEKVAKLDYNLENQLPKFREAGFRIMYRNQAYPVHRFYEAEQAWEYLMGHSEHFPGLFGKAEAVREQVKKEIATQGFLELEEHLFIVIAKKR